MANDFFCEKSLQYRPYSSAYSKAGGIWFIPVLIVPDLFLLIT